MTSILYNAKAYGGNETDPDSSINNLAGDRHVIDFPWTERFDVNICCLLNSELFVLIHILSVFSFSLLTKAASFLIITFNFYTGQGFNSFHKCVCSDKG